MRLLRALLFLYLMFICGFMALVWSLLPVALLVKTAEGRHIKDEAVGWMFAALALVVVPGFVYATRWLWRRWRKPV